MSARDSDRELDDLLHDDGGKIGSLYQRLPRYEPPRRLDRAVLGEAARAIRSGKPPRRQRWIVGFGSAAGIVLAAGIAWRIGHDPFGSQATQNAAPTVVPVQPISESARARHAESASPADAARNDAITPVESAAPAAGMVAAPTASRAEPAPHRKTSVATRQPTPAPAAPAPPPSAVMKAAPAKTPSNTASERFEDDRAAGAASDAASSAQSLGSDAKREQSPLSSRMAPALSAPSGSVELQRDTQLAPQDWLAHIGQLARQGRTQQATESLRLFHRAHPDWAIPDELAPLLK